MELRQLQIFCAAAQTLNFTKAGVKLGYTQTNITGQVRQLEEELQTKLFERMGRGVQLTTAGKNFLEKATSILDLCEKAKEDFLTQGIRGVLNIGAAETPCVYRLPKILTEYRKLYPQVEIRVQTESCEHFFELIKSGAVDIALVMTNKVKAPEMTAQVLYDEPMTVVASPLHPLAQKEKIIPDDLSGECLMITLPGCGYRPLILSMISDYHVKPGAIMELSSIAAIRQCTICGLGVAILPQIAVKDDLDRGNLVALAWNGPEFDVKTQLVVHREKWLTPAMRVFLAMCHAIARPL